MKFLKKCKNIPKGWKITLYIVLGLLAFAAVAVVLGLVIMWLWNAIVAPKLNAGTINYWEAVGLFVLCKILFGGFRFKNNDEKCECEGKCECEEKCDNVEIEGI